MFIFNKPVTGFDLNKVENFIFTSLLFLCCLHKVRRKENKYVRGSRHH